MRGGFSSKPRRGPPRAQGWETLVFDLEEGVTERSPRLDLNQGYDQLVLFPAFLEEPGAYGGELFQFDDLVLLGAQDAEACAPVVSAVNRN